MEDTGLKTKLVSIIVPVYNTSLYLKKCIESILAQTYPYFELILVDDGSKDESGAICDAFANKDERVKVLHQENQGVAKSRINGFAMSSGSYVCFIDSDDFIHSEMLNRMVRAIKENRTDIVVCQYFDVSGAKKIESLVRPLPGLYGRETLTSFLKKNALYDRKTKIAGMPFYLHSKIYKRELVINLLEKGVGLWYEEDLVGILSLLYSIQSMVVIPDYLYYYVRHSGQTVTSFKPDIFDNYLKVIEKIEKIDTNNFLNEQLPLRIFSEISNMLAICIRNTHQYNIFEKLFLNISNNVVKAGL